MHGHHLDVNYPCHQLLDDGHSVLVVATLAGTTVDSSRQNCRGNSPTVCHSRYNIVVTSALWAGSASTELRYDHGEDLLMSRVSAYEVTNSVEASEHAEVQY